MEDVRAVQRAGSLRRSTGIRVEPCWLLNGEGHDMLRSGKTWNRSGL